MYVTCHGVMLNTNYIILNEVDPKKRYFNLEWSIMTLVSNFKGTSVFVHWDCCRTKTSYEQVTGKPNVPVSKKAPISTSNSQNIVANMSGPKDIKLSSSNGGQVMLQLLN